MKREYNTGVGGGGVFGGGAPTHPGGAGGIGGAHPSGGDGSETIPFMRPLQGSTGAEIEAAEKSWSEWLAMEDWMLGERCPEGLRGVGAGRVHVGQQAQAQHSSSNVAGGGGGGGQGQAQAGSGAGERGDREAR